MFLITGASSGIGEYLFDHYSETHEDCFGTYFSSVSKSSKKGLTKVDITDSNDIQSWVNSCVDQSENKKIVLINSAGISYNSFAHKADIEPWKKTIEANLIGPFNAIKECLPIMRDQQYGRIVNFGSVVSQIGVPGTSAYAASKSGLWGLGKSIAKENAAKNITINTLNLGYFDIGMINSIPKENLEEIINAIPSRKLGQKENIIKTIDYLISSPYINGSSLDINGGLF